MSDQRVLVTGGSGFIGTNVVQLYLDRGVAVLNLDIARPRNPAHTHVWQRVDLCSERELSRAVVDFAPTHLFHLGARTDLEGRTLREYAANVEGVAAVIAAVRNLASIERVVFASSRMVCRIGYTPESDTDYCPPNAYGESKVAGEQIVRAASLSIPWVIVRPTSIWGPWFDVPYKTFFLTIARGRYLHIRGHAVDKSFGFVGNTTYELDRLVSASPSVMDGKTLYLADYPPLNVRDFAERIRREIGARRIPTVPLIFAQALAATGDLLQRLGWRHPPLTTFRLANLVTEMVFDLSQLQAIVGVLPYSLDEGIRLTVEWLRSRGEV